MVSAIKSATSSLTAAGYPGGARQTLRMLQASGRPPDPKDPAIVRETAAQFASELFLKPLLAEVRQFPFGRDLACGGQTEAIFGEQLDQRIADRVAATTPGLVNQIVRQIEGQVTPPNDQATWLPHSWLRAAGKGDGA